MHVRAEAASAAAVRAGLTADLAAHGLSADARNDVALVATELITNAIQHGQPLPSDELAVEWSTEGEDVLIQVTDGGGSSHPRLMSSGPDDTERARSCHRPLARLELGGRHRYRPSDGVGQGAAFAVNHAFARHLGRGGRSPPRASRP